MNRPKRLLFLINLNESEVSLRRCGTVEAEDPLSRGVVSQLKGRHSVATFSYSISLSSHFWCRSSTLPCPCGQIHKRPSGGRRRNQGCQLGSKLRSVESSRLIIPTRRNPTSAILIGKNISSYKFQGPTGVPRLRILILDGWKKRRRRNPSGPSSSHSTSNKAPPSLSHQLHCLIMALRTYTRSFHFPHTSHHPPS